MFFHKWIVPCSNSEAGNMTGYGATRSPKQHTKDDASAKECQRACLPKSSVQFPFLSPREAFRKRGRSFGMEMNQSPCKWNRLDTLSNQLPSQRAATSNLDHKNMEQASSSASLSAADDDGDDTANIPPRACRRVTSRFQTEQISSPINCSSQQNEPSSVSRGGATNTKSCPQKSQHTFESFGGRLLRRHRQQRQQSEQQQQTSNSSRDRSPLRTHYSVESSCSKIIIRKITNRSDVLEHQKRESENTSSSCNRRTSPQNLEMIPVKSSSRFKGFLVAFGSDYIVQAVTSEVNDCLGIDQNQMVGQSLRDFVYPPQFSMLKRFIRLCSRPNCQRLSSASHRTVRVGMKCGFQNDDTSTKPACYRTIEWRISLTRSPEANSNNKRNSTRSKNAFICCCSPCVDASYQPCDMERGLMSVPGTLQPLQCIMRFLYSLRDVLSRDSNFTSVDTLCKGLAPLSLAISSGSGACTSCGHSRSPSSCSASHTTSDSALVLKGSLGNPQLCSICRSLHRLHSCTRGSQLLCGQHSASISRMIKTSLLALNEGSKSDKSKLHSLCHTHSHSHCRVEKTAHRKPNSLFKTKQISHLIKSLAHPKNSSQFDSSRTTECSSCDKRLCSVAGIVNNTTKCFQTETATDSHTEEGECLKPKQAVFVDTHSHSQDDHINSDRNNPQTILFCSALFPNSTSESVSWTSTSTQSDANSVYSCEIESSSSNTYPRNSNFNLTDLPPSVETYFSTIVKRNEEPKQKGETSILQVEYSTPHLNSDETRSSIDQSQGVSNNQDIFQEGIYLEVQGQGSEELMEYNFPSSDSSISQALDSTVVDDLDFSSEYSFQTNDTIMPVENVMSDRSDLDLNQLSLPVDDQGDRGVTPIENTDSEINIDTFPISDSGDFSYSYTNCSQLEEFEPFNHILDEAVPSITQLSNMDGMATPFTPSAGKYIDVTRHVSNVLMETEPSIIGDGTAENMNSPSEYIFNFNKNIKNAKEMRTNNNLTKPLTPRSLLRTLLNTKDANGESVSTVVDQSQRVLPDNTFNSAQKTNVTNKTKQLPIPKTLSILKSKPLPSISISKTESRSFNQGKSLLRDVCQEPSTLSVSTASTPIHTLTERPTASPQTIWIQGSTNSQSDLLSDQFSPAEDDTLPEELLDLAMEYCSSLDPTEANSLMTELNEHIDWAPEPGTPESQSQNFTPLGPENKFHSNTHFELMPGTYQHGQGNAHYLTSSRIAATVIDSQNIFSPRSFLADSNSNNKNLPAFLPDPTPVSRFTNFHQSTDDCSSQNIDSSCFTASVTSNQLANNSQPHRDSTNSLPSTGGQRLSLLRQAITSPDVDKLIEQTPLGQQLLLSSRNRSESSKRSNQNLKPVSTIEKADRCVTRPRARRNSCEKIRNTSAGEKTVEVTRLTPKRVHDKAKGVSHFAISIPNYLSPKKPHTEESSNSSIQLTISISNDDKRPKQQRPKAMKYSSPKASTSCQRPNSSSSEPVSVMVMRKENHKSRRSKTVSTQTDNHPDEVYPELERSPTDVIMTPSVYFDTPSSTLSVKSSIVQTKPSLNINCNRFSSGLRSLSCSRDHRELAASSPCSSHPSPSSHSSSSSSISELELHLRGMSSPDSSLSSPRSCESEVSSSDSIPFLQRLLTGELNKDRYEKLDRDLMEKGRSSSSSSSSALDTC